MSKTYQVRCLKCGQQYKDIDPDPYYCPPCNEQKKKIASKIDKKIGSQPKKERVPSFQERIDALPKIPGTNIPFIT